MSNMRPTPLAVLGHNPAVMSRRKSRVPSAKQGSSLRVPIAAVFSFLKETRGMVTWTTEDLAAVLLITERVAGEIIPLLTMQGYVRATGKDSEWLTTMAGENVSGSATPRFSREAVQRALDSLSDRIRELNRERSSDFVIPSAVAFGDVLSNRPRVQAADVGIQLKRKTGKRDSKFAAASERAVERALLKSLRNRSQLLHLCPYQDWMGARTHRRLF